jgi:UDP-2,3-diacylglucosamine hydrolase
MTQRSDTSSSTANEAQPDTVALFVSDVHLQAAMPRTTQAFLRFLEQDARHTRQLYLLGDLFEAWAGDDDIDDPYNRQIVEAIRRVSDAGVEVFWIAGNRDFLVAEGFAERAGLNLLQEPYVITLAGQRIALVHGDAQCTDDTAYMVFRAQVRHPDTQKQFLSMPLAQRKIMIANMREGSREAQQTKSYEIMDVNANAIDALFDETGASIIIHGHTHRPARHDDKARQRIRYVLPDWDCDTGQQRGGWLGIDAGGTITRYGVDGQSQ